MFRQIQPCNRTATILSILPQCPSSPPLHGLTHLPPLLLVIAVQQMYIRGAI